MTTTLGSVRATTRAWLPPPGEILVLLNNDTVVPRGWLTRLARHLDDAAIGLIGPATNRSCNEAQIDISLPDLWRVPGGGPLPG